MSRFEQLVKNGLTKAAETEKNILEIELVFTDLNNEIKKVTNGKVTFGRHPPDTLIVWAKAMKPELNPKKSGRLALKGTSNQMEVIAYWEQAPDGYPFTISYDGQRHDCWDEESLIKILGNIVSSGAFWISVNKLK